MKPTVFDRYWINQPSDLQPMHKYHGMNVLAPKDITEKFIRVYPTSTNIISMECPALSLSKGWK